jgi:hypothetical protein
MVSRQSIAALAQRSFAEFSTRLRMQVPGRDLQFKRNFTLCKPVNAQGGKRISSANGRNIACLSWSLISGTLRWMGACAFAVRPGPTDICFKEQIRFGRGFLRA